MEFKRSDVVSLKSGGGNMMVDKTRGERVFCVWLDTAKRIKERWFHADLLQPGGKAKGVVSLIINRWRAPDDPTPLPS